MQVSYSVLLGNEVKGGEDEKNKGLRHAILFDLRQEEAPQSLGMKQDQEGEELNETPVENLMHSLSYHCHCYYCCCCCCCGCFCFGHDDDDDDDGNLCWRSCFLRRNKF